MIDLIEMMFRLFVMLDHRIGFQMDDKGGNVIDLIEMVFRLFVMSDHRIGFLM